MVVLLITALFAVLMPALPVRAVQKTLHIEWSYPEENIAQVSAWRIFVDGVLAEEILVSDMADPSVLAHDLTLELNSRKTRIRMTAVQYDAEGVVLNQSPEKIMVEVN